MRTPATRFLVVLLFAAGCGGVADDSTCGSKCDDTDPGIVTHSAAVQACDDAFDAVFDAVFDDDDLDDGGLQEAARQWNECLAGANDAAIAAIDAAFQGTADSTAAESVASLRAIDHCSLLIFVLSEPGEPADPSAGAQCLALREKFIGKLIDGWSSLPGATHEDRDDWELFSECAEAHQEALGPDPAVSESQAAADALVDCVMRDLIDVRIPTIIAVLEGVEGAPDVDAATLEALVSGTRAHLAATCDIMAAAGIGADGDDEMRSAEAALCTAAGVSRFVSPFAPIFISF